MTLALLEPLRNVRLELETKVPAQQGGGFLEVLVRVGEAERGRPRQLKLGQGREEVPLEDLPKGLHRIAIHVSSRSNLRVKFVGLRLLHD